MSPTAVGADLGPSDDGPIVQQQHQFMEDSETSNSSQPQSRVIVVTPAASPNATSFSVINYVGKVQKQSSHRSTGRCRTPYERSSRPSRVESLDEATNSSTASSVDYCSGTGDSASIVSDAPDMVDLDEEQDGEGGQRPLPPHQGQLNLAPHLYHGPRSRRSMSVSSSGCSSSMDDRNCDFSPLGSSTGCRCTSLSISDFDDDGFREDGSVSSMYSVFSSSRSYQPHHPLHHNHQHVPHHPNNTKGLFDIALKTVKLIRRNQELQMRLAQLQVETNAFIESVMANPENETLRNRFQTAAASSAGTTPATVALK
ncbi:hypothetical protein quinque_001210 [Culex quinquefasciatus]|uniref:uncharacterized protein LOC120421242 n=1 Tax=Culex pipiens pallens TaxID=42434 RepID=UPI002279F204|nr:uncharacterized protein LOC120421242 [Culex pipiens pallens]